MTKHQGDASTPGPITGAGFAGTLYGQPATATEMVAAQQLLDAAAIRAAAISASTIRASVISPGGTVAGPSPTFPFARPIHDPETLTETLTWVDKALDGTGGLLIFLPWLASGMVGMVATLGDTELPALVGLGLTLANMAGGCAMMLWVMRQRRVVKTLKWRYYFKTGEKA